MLKTYTHTQNSCLHHVTPVLFPRRQEPDAFSCLSSAFLFQHLGKAPDLHLRGAPLHLLLPRILCSTPFAISSYFLIWLVPPFEQGKVVWYLIFYCLFQSMQTVRSTRTPHSSPLWSLLCLNSFFFLLSSASMCHIQPSPCSSAQTRRSGTLPLPIVGPAERRGFACASSFPSPIFHLCAPLRHDGRGAGHGSGNRHPRADRGRHQ